MENLSRTESLVRGLLAAALFPSTIERSTVSPLQAVALLATAVALAAVFTGANVPPAYAVPPALVVPTDYPTIQAAIDAAKPGRTVKVLAGTYTEQITITKKLAIVGAGMDATIIRAPATLVPGQLPFPSIVEIYDGASVSMSHLTVSGPGSVACGAVDGSGNALPRLRWGIRVHSRAHLDFGYAAVRDIHDTPFAQCPRSGNGIVVGLPGAPPASANIHHSEVTNFQTAGIVALGEGTWANVVHSIVTGPGHTGGVPTDGIELVAGAVGTISHNTVSGNVCPAGFEFDCGEDFFGVFQHGGIVAGGNGPGTVITHNLVFGNQIGLYLSEVDELSQNVMRDNEYFGLGLAGFTDGSFTVDGGEITGGDGGMWVVAVFVDTTVVLNNVRFSGQSGPAVEILEDGGFTATVIGGP